MSIGIDGTNEVNPIDGCCVLGETDVYCGDGSSEVGSLVSVGMYVDKLGDGAGVEGDAVGVMLRPRQYPTSVHAVIQASGVA